MQKVLKRLFQYRMRHYLIFSAKTLVALAILVFLFTSSQLKPELIYTLFKHPYQILLIILLCYLMVFTHTWRWYRFNSVQGISLSFQQTLMPTYLGVAFNTVLPGSVGGDFVRLVCVFKQFPSQRAHGAIAILIDRISGLLGVFIIGCLLMPYYSDLFWSNGDMSRLLMCCFIISIGAVGFILILFTLCSEKVGFSRWIKQATSRFAILKPFALLLEVVHLYKSAKWIIFESLIVSMATQLLLLLVIIMIGGMMGLPPISPMDYLLALVIGQVANLVPLTPGGVGIGEAAFSNIIQIINPGTVGAYATVFFGLRILSMLAYLPGVFIGIFGKYLLSSRQVQMTK